MPTKFQVWKPSDIEWQEINADGTKYALLEGVKDVAGAVFTYAFFIPGGVWDSPHVHTADARIVVVSGVLKLGLGDNLDKTQAQTFETGSYLLVPANVVHFDGADVDTLIIGTATGVWATTYLTS